MSEAQDNKEYAVVVLGGLKGPDGMRSADGEHFAETFTTNQLRRDLKKEANVTVSEIEYQWPTKEGILQPFSYLGKKAAWGINKLLGEGKEVVVYASSVGGSILIQALPYIERPIDAVMNAPVINPLAKGAQMIFGAEKKFQAELAAITEPEARESKLKQQPFKLLDAVVNNAAPGLALPIPVSYNDKIELSPGSVPLKAEHFNDLIAYQLIRNPSAMFAGLSDKAIANMATVGHSAAKWVEDVQKAGGLRSLDLLFTEGQGDPYCLEAEARGFVQIAQPVVATPINAVVKTTGHNERSDLPVLNGVRGKLGLPLHTPTV